MANEDLMRGPDETGLPNETDLSDAEMAAEMLGQSPDEMDVPFEDDADFVEVDMMEASMTAIGTVATEEFEGNQCLIGQAIVEGDASMSATAIGMLTAGSVGLHQGGAGVLVVEGDVAIEQGAAQLIVAKRVDMDQAGAGVMVVGDASVARSWVGLMAARNATVPDAPRVLIDAKAAPTLGCLPFGGLRLVAIAVFLGARRMAARLPRLPHWAHSVHGMPSHLRNVRMPEIPKLPDLPKMPDMSAIADMIAKLRHAG